MFYALGRRTRSSYCRRAVLAVFLCVLARDGGTDSLCFGYGFFIVFAFGQSFLYFEKHRTFSARIAMRRVKAFAFVFIKLRSKNKAAAQKRRGFVVSYRKRTCFNGQSTNIAAVAVALPYVSSTSDISASACSYSSGSVIREIASMS